MTHDELARAAMAGAMILLGVGALAWPRCFAGVAGYFTRWSADLSSADRARLDRVVDARENAEGISATYGRYLGIAGILLAGLELIPTVPMVAPYALFCLVVAGITLLAYLQFRRAADKRVAPLVRRSPFTALPPLVIAAIAWSFLADVALSAYAPVRLSAILVAISTLVLGMIAWRIANAPALLIGSDPQWEYAVDERVRIGRARTVANLACAPALIVIALAERSLPPEYALIGSITFGISAAATLITIAASLLPLRRRIVPA